MGLGVVHSQVHQWQLLFTIFAHFVVAPIFILIVWNIDRLVPFVILLKKFTAKCAFYVTRLVIFVVEHYQNAQLTMA